MVKKILLHQLEQKTTNFAFFPIINYSSLVFFIRLHHLMTGDWLRAAAEEWPQSDEQRWKWEAWLLFKVKYLKCESCKVLFVWLFVCLTRLGAVARPVCVCACVVSWMCAVQLLNQKWGTLLIRSQAELSHVWRENVFEPADGKMDI